MSFSRSRPLALALVAAALAAAPRPAYAQSYYWRLSGVNWSDGFTPSAPTPSSTTGLYFSSDANNVGGSSSSNNNLGDNFLLNNLNFANRFWNVTGNSLRFVSGGAINAYSYVAQVSNRIALDGAFTVNTSGGQLALNGVISDTATAIAGGSRVGSLVKTGADSLALGATNTYRGGTTIQAGLIQANADNVLGTGSLTLTGGTLALNGKTVTVANLILGDGAATSTGTVSGAGTLALNGGVTFNGAANRATAPATISANLALSSGQHAFNDNGVYSSATYDTVLSGVVSGAGGLDKNGISYLALTGKNTYAGATNVSGSGGVLALGTANALPTSTALTVGSGSYVFLSPTVTQGGVVAGSYDQTVGSLAGAGEVRLGAATLTVGNAFDTSFSGKITGSGGSLVKQGAGTLTLLGTSSFTGGTTVNGGQINVGAPNALSTATALSLGANGTLVLSANQTVGSLAGAGGVRLAGTTLTVDDATDTAFSGTIYGTGTLLKQGAGTLTLSGANTYTGNTTVSAGTLQASAANVLPMTTALTVASGATLNLGSFPNKYNQTVASLAGSGTIKLGDSNLTVGDTTSTTFSGSLASNGTGSLVKQGAGTLTLAGSNDSYHTFVYGGTIRAGSNSATSNYLSLAGGNLDLNGFDQSVYRLELGDGLATNASTVSGPGTLAVVSILVNGRIDGTTVPANVSSALSFSGSASNSYIVQTGNINSPLGTQDAVFSGPISGSGTLSKIGSNTATFTGPMGFDGEVRVNGGRLVVAQPSGAQQYNVTSARGGVLEFSSDADALYPNDVTGTGPVVKSGAGTLTVTTPFTNAGGTTVQAGTLKGAPGAFGTGIVGGANGTLQIDAATPGIFSGGYSGAGRLLKTGTGLVIVNGTLSNTGATTIQGGGMLFTATNALGGNLSLASGASLSNYTGGTLSVAGTMVNQGEVVTLGGSRTVFNGRVSGAGAFTGLGEVDFNGGYSPGNSPAAVTLQGDMRLGSANDLVMELAGTTLGTGYDHLTVRGTAFLDGTLSVAYYGGFAASAGQSFDLFDFGTATGAFSSVLLPTLGSDLSWDTSGLYSTGVIRVSANPTPEPSALAGLAFGAVAFVGRRRKA